VIIVRVTAQAGNFQDYVITVNRAAASSNALLQSLNMTPVNISGFSPSTFSYNVSVGFGTTSVVVTAAVQAGTSTMTINGQATASGQPRTISGLQVGNNTITVRVTAQAGNTQDYVITVNRAAGSTNANLSGLVLSAGALSPAFAPSTISYSVTTTQSSTTVTATVQDSTATMTLFLNGASQGALSNGVPSAALPLALAPATNTIVVRVTAQAGNMQNYTITVTRNP
jgi:hypothetical protein